MKTPLTLSLFCFLGLSVASAQDTVRFDVWGNYPSQTLPSAVTQAGLPFDFSFTLNSTVSASDSLAVDGSLQWSGPVLAGSYTLNGVTTDALSGWFGFSSHLGNESHLQLDLPGDTVNLDSFAWTGGTLPVLLGSQEANGVRAFTIGDLGQATLSAAQWSFGGVDYFVSSLPVNVSGGLIPGVAPVPEPSTCALLAVSALALTGWTIRRAKGA